MPIVNIQGVGQVNFPDEMSDQQIQAAIETEILPQFPEVQAKAPRGVVGGAKDIGASFLAGVGNLMQLPGQLGTLAGASSPERQDVGIQGMGQELEKYAQGLKTPTLRAKEQLLARDVAKADGFFEEAGVQLKGLATDPALLSSFFTEQVPNLIGSFGIGVLGKGGAKLLLKNATEEAVSKVGVRSAIGGGAVMQGTDIGYDTYLQIYERLKEEGVSEEEAQGIALAKGRVAALEAAGLSLASTKLPGGASIEKAMLGKGLPGTGGFLKSTLGEAVSEAVEEGGGKFASNVGLQEVFPETELLKGVGASTAMGGLGGALFGAPAGVALGARARREAEVARQLEEQNKPPVEEVEDTGLAGTREVYADEADRERVEAFRALQARKESTAFQKLDELNQQVKAKQAEEDARKASGSAFSTAEFDEQGNVIAPREEPTGLAGLLPYDPTAGKSPYFVFPDGSVATSKEAAFAAKYAPQLSTEGVNEVLGRFNAMPDLPEVSSENITRFGFVPEGSNTVQVTEGEKVTRKDGDYLKFFDENGKTMFRKMDKVLVNPTEDDIINLEYDNAFKTIELGTNDFANWLTKQGVKADQMVDVIGDSKKSRNKVISTNKDKRRLFREDGQQLDELATRARDAGFMTQADIDADGDVGGVRKLTEMINEAWNGNIVVTPKMQEAFAQIEQLENMFDQRRAQVQQQPQPTEADLAPLEGADLEADILAQAQAIPQEQFVPEGAPIAQEISEETAPVEMAYKQAVEQGVIPEPKAEMRQPQGYYTDKFLAEGETLAKNMRASLDKMGLKGVGLNLEDSIYQLINGRMTEVNGNYFDKLIQVSLSGDNMLRTLNHESLHAMKELGFFSDAEWNMLSDMATKQWLQKYNIKQRYPNLNQEEQIEEAIADAFAERQTQPPAVKSIIARMVEMLKRLANVLRGKGFRTVDSIFESAAEGKLAEGKAKAQPSKRAEKADSFGKWFGNSKIVDGNGAPRVMYHGTTSDITKFSPNQFFTLSPEAANSYALKEQYEQGTRFDAESEGIKGANILPVYIKAENIASADDVLNTAQKLGVYDPNAEDSYLYTSSYTDKNVSDAVINDLKKQGFDSIFHYDYDLDGNRIESLQVFNPGNIKSSTGNVGDFSQADADIRAETKQPKAEVPTPKQLKSTMDGVNPDVAQRIIAQFTKTPLTVKQKFDSLRPNMAERLIQGLFDEFRSIKKYSEEAYMKAVLSKSTDGALEGLLYYGQVELKDGALIYKKGTKGLLDILEPLGTEVDRYQIWKALNRDARLPVDKRSFKDLIGDRDELINGQINGVPRKQVYEKALKEENELNRSVLDIAKAQGLIDDAAYERFSNDIYYIPFYSEMEDGDIGSINASSKLTNQYFSKKLKGGGRKTNDLMENVLMNWSHILSASMKNAAAVSALKSAADLNAAQKVKQTTVKGATQYYYMENGERVFVNKNEVVKVMEGGNESAYLVTDNLLMDSISLISSIGPKFPGLDIAKGFTDALRYGVTLSPAYKIRNLIRDAVQSAAVSRVGLNVYDNVVQGLKLSSRDNPTFIDALIAGGVFEMGVAHEGDQAKMVKRLIKQGVAQGTILDTPEKVKDALGKALDWYNEQGNRFENANRLTLFKKLTDEGKSHLEAAFSARDLMNFSSQGSFRAIKVISQLVPFFNARLQGLYKLGRDGITPTYRLIYNTTTGKPIEASDKIKAQSFMAVSSAVMLASALLYLSFKDDEDFKRRENWDRDNFWWFKIGDTQFRIPKPFEIGALGTIMERTLEQVTDDKVEGKVFADRMQNILWETFSLNPIPQAAKPLIDLYADKDSFTGAPIESESLKRLSKQERYTESTSALAKVLASISQGTAQALTLDKNAEGLSPVQVDFALKAYLGWAGSTAASVSDKAVQPWSEVEKPGKPLVDTLGMGFIKTMPETQSKYVTAFYENNQRINQAFADMKRYAETGQMEKVADVLKEKGDLIALQKVYDKTAKQLAEYRKYIQIIARDPKMSKADKEAEIARAKIVISEMTRLAEETRVSLKK
jgi:hypothetical protein